jgi:hypothetical protein
MELVIFNAWRIHEYPTIVLLDHNGIIRHKWLHNPGTNILDQSVEKLVKEAEEANAKQDAKQCARCELSAIDCD